MKKLNFFIFLKSSLALPMERLMWLAHGKAHWLCRWKGSCGLHMEKLIGFADGKAHRLCRWEGSSTLSMEAWVTGEVER